MADPAWTDATRDALFQRLGFILGLERDLALMERHLHPANDQYVAVMRAGDEDGTDLTDFQFTAGKIRTDTDVNGLVYGTVTDSGGNATVDLYNDSGRSTKVSTGTGADGAALTMAAQTGYTLAGTVTIGTIAATFNFTFQLVKSPVKRAEDEFDATLAEDEQNKLALLAALETARSRVLQAQQAIRGVAAQVLQTSFRNQLVTSSDAAALLNSDALKVGTNGQIDLQPRGLLKDLERGMEDNSTGSGVVKAGPPAATPVVSYPGSWTGKTSASPSATELMLGGNLQLNCDKGLDGTSPTFLAVFTPTDNRRKGGSNFSEDLPGEQKMTLGQQWNSHAFGLEGLLVNYAPTIANETGIALDTTSTSWTVTGLTSSNSTGGKLWLYLSGTTLQFYSTEAGRDAQDADLLVTQATGVSTSTAFTSEDTGTGLVVVGLMSGTIVTADTGNVDFNAPTAGSTTADFSYIKVAVALTTNHSAWSARFRDGGVGGVSWKINTASTPNVVDGWIRAGQLIGSQDRFGDAD